MTNLTRSRELLTFALGLTAAFVLTSCGQTSDAPATSQTAAATAPTPSVSATPSAATSSPSATTAVRAIDVTVEGKQVTPAPATVNIARGESLTIAVTSDVDNTLHAHGFEIEKNLKAGQRGEITIKGAEPGIYEFELHDPQLKLFQVAVR